MINRNVIRDSSYITYVVWILVLALPVLGLAQQSKDVTYIYDDLNRLTEVQYDNGTVIAYEYDEVGNRLARVVQSSVPNQPDLTPTTGYITTTGNSGNVGPGGDFSITYTAENIGSASSGGFNTGIAISDDLVYNGPGTDQLLKLVSTSNMTAGAMNDVTVQLTVPDDLAPGQHYLLVYMDPDNVVNNELSETNNQVAFLLDVVDCSNFSVSLAPTDANCEQDNGYIATVPQGGAGNYSYQWSTLPVQTTSTAIGLSPGTYSVTVTDDNGCLATGSTSLDNNGQQPIASFTNSAVGTNVSFQHTGAFGTGYAWTFGDGNTSSIASPSHTYAATGTYTVCQTVSNNCGSDQHCENLTITATNCPAVIDAAVTSVSTNGVSINWTPVNGATGYQFRFRVSGATNWTQLNLTSPYMNLTGLLEGTLYEYEVQTICGDGVSDFTGTQLFTTESSTNDCANTTATISASSSAICPGETISFQYAGTGASVFTWTLEPAGTVLGSSSSLTHTFPQAGVQTVRLTVGNGSDCVKTEDFVLTVHALPDITLSTTDEQCGQSDGTALVIVNSSGSHSILWNTGAQTSTISNLAAGLYGVQVANVEGCVTSANATVSNTSDGFTLSNVVNDVSCNGSTDGSITLSTNGTVGNVTVNWSTGAMGSQLTGLPAASYTATVSDGAGCEQIEVFMVDQPDALTISTTTTNNTDCVNPNGTIISNVSGGTPPYSFTWSDAASTVGSLVGLRNYDGTVLVTDANGCTAGTTATVLDESATCTDCVACCADLSISPVTITSIGTNTISYQYTVYNSGNVPITFPGPNAGGGYYSRQAFGSVDGQSLDDAGSGYAIFLGAPLAVGDSLTFFHTSAIDLSVHPYLIVLIDWNQNLDECDETNNRSVNLLPPYNGEICKAVEIACGNTYEGYTTNGTSDVPTGITTHCGSGGTQAPNVFYKLPGADGTVTLSLCGSGYDTRMDVYCVPAGTVCDANTVYNCVAGNDDANCSGGGFNPYNSEITVNTYATLDYYVMVHGYANSTLTAIRDGFFELSVNCAPSCTLAINHSCELTANSCGPGGQAATLIVQTTGDCPTYTTGDNTCTTNGLNPLCDPYAQIKDVWYVFNSGDSTSVDIDLVSSGTNPASNLNFAVYTECGGNILTCQEDVTSSTIPGLSSNQDYFIQVWTTEADAGEFGICLYHKPLPVELELNAILQGAYDPSTGLMRDQLRTTGVLPTTEPYTALGYTLTQNVGASVAPSVFNVSDGTAIVDWVVVELRDATDPAVIVASRPALLRRDGSVARLNGTNTVLDFDAPAGDYYVCLNHRNHLGVMSASTMSLSAGSAPFMSFDNMNVPVWGTNGRYEAGNVPMLWAGDSNGDNNVIYQGASSDLVPLTFAVYTNPENSSFQASFPFNGYSNADTNMDGTVIYQGASSDIIPITISVYSNPANGSFEASYPVVGQVPQ